MRDPIERQEAIETVADMLWHFPNESYKCFNNYSYSEAFAKDALGRLPSAQPEIIRCKECKHRPFDGEDTQGFGVEFPDRVCPCQCSDGWYNWRPNDEWFCGDAERRTDQPEMKEGRWEWDGEYVCSACGYRGPHGERLTWQDCPYTCEYATEMRRWAEAKGENDEQSERSN